MHAHTCILLLLTADAIHTMTTEGGSAGSPQAAPVPELVPVPVPMAMPVVDTQPTPANPDG